MNEQVLTADDYARRPRSLERYTVRRCRDLGDRVEISTEQGTGFVRSKKDIGLPLLEVGDEFDLETIQLSFITGLRDAAGRWRFRLTNQRLADDANAASADWERKKTIELERNMRRYNEIEEALPAWLRARIQRFRDAAGEQFLRDGWGYELVICRLADAMAAGDEDRVSAIDEEEGASGNQHGCARLLAQLHADGHDGDVVALPAGLAPLTGSVDYS
jgi:hypothetical protein